MRRLTPVKATRLNEIVGPQREIHRVFSVEIEVPETKVVRPVRVLVPTFENGDYRLTRRPQIGQAPLRSSNRNPGQ